MKEFIQILVAAFITLTISLIVITNKEARFENEMIERKNVCVSSILNARETSSFSGYWFTEDAKDTKELLENTNALKAEIETIQDKYDKLFNFAGCLLDNH